MADSELGLRAKNRICFKVRMIGTFAIHTLDGRNITPSHKKNCALLVLLLTAPGLERGRRWIEATLWSDRQEREAGQSLRTSLSGLRRHFSEFGDVIETDRNNVRLLSDMFEVDLLSGDRWSGHPDILEGMSLRDEAFEIWLREFRSIQHEELGASNVPFGPSLIDIPSSFARARRHEAGSQSEQFVADFLLDQIDQNLFESFGAGLPILGSEQGKHAQSNTALIIPSVVESRGKTHVAIRIENGTTGQRIWSGRRVIPAASIDFSKCAELLSLAFGVSSAVIETAREFPQYGEDPAWDAKTLLARAVPEMFSFDPARLRIAEELLRAAEARAPSPINKAWLSLLYQFILAERIHDNNEIIKEKSESYLNLALEQAPNNAQIYAIASVVRQLLGENFEAGMAYARHALSINPGNALARVGMAISYMREGKSGDALGAIIEAHSIAENTPFLNWVEMFVSLASISCEDFDLAIKSAESALCRSPNFRPPMRHLYALHLGDGNKGLATKVLCRLQKVEPNFSLNNIREDPTYPASTLRNSSLIELSDI